MAGPITNLQPLQTGGKITNLQPIGQGASTEPQQSGFFPSVAQFVEGRSPWYQDSDPLRAAMKQSVAPLNIAKNLASGIKGAVSGAGEMASDLASNPNWFSTMPAGQRPSTMQRFVTDPARAQVAQAEASPDTMQKAGHYLAAAVPLAGPWAASLGEQAGKGDVGGAAAQAAGGYIGTKGVAKTFDLAKHTGDFMRRATSNEDVWEAASGHYLQNVQPQIQTISEAMKREGAKTIDQAIQADRAAQTIQGRGTISAAPAIVEAAKAIEDTGYTPQPAIRSLLNKLNSQSLMTLEDAKNLRSDFGQAASRADRMGNAKAAKILWSAYDEIGENGMRPRVEELQGSRKPYDHYNNEFKASFELNKGIAGQMMDSIADRHEAVDKLRNFSTASIKELQDQMDKYGIDSKKLADAQKEAKSIVAAHDSINGKLNKSAYRIIMGGGSAAAAAASMYMIAKGMGASALLPMALASYAGSVYAGMPPRIETGRLLQRYRMIPNASQVRTLVEGPQNFQYRGPEFEGFKGPKESPSEPPKSFDDFKAQQIQAVQERRVNPPNFPTTESRRASDAAFAKNYPNDKFTGMSPMEKDLWQESVFGQKPEGDIGAKVRAANPEPTRAEVKAAQLKKVKRAKE
jgi:hypothetical protein